MFIKLLIGLLIGLIICNFISFNFREGQGPMVGSIMFPTMYQGKTDVSHKPIKVKEKQGSNLPFTKTHSLMRYHPIFRKL